MVVSSWCLSLTPGDVEKSAVADWLAKKLENGRKFTAGRHSKQALM
jgi:hypothetical protein